MPGKTERELLQALAPVKAHFHGSKVTPGTVLAAYLRAAGMSAGGDEWQLAKAAFDAGLSFDESVRQVSANLRRRTSPTPSPAKPRFDPPDPDLVAAKPFQSPSAAAATPASSVTNPAPVDPFIVDFHMADQGADSPSLPPETTCDVQALEDTEPLAWFPKVCGPGDIIGDGAKKLLGQPKLDPVALLVRETAQNSWDARLAESIEFKINLRRLPSAQRDILRRHIFTGHPEALGLPESLAKDDLWVIEVSDRGTKGLGGPVRNDLPIDPLEPTDFIDLMFNIGAPRDVHLGGGTYGFGKTVGYILSRCSTTLVWSRCQTATGIQDRIMGSAIGAGYDDSRSRYTGRHWWGEHPVGREGIEPALNARASELGRAVFAGGFEGQETGTSLMILDPVFNGDTPEEYAAKVAEAVLWNLWPKLVPDSNGKTPMAIDVQLNGVSVPLHSPRDHPILNAYVDCLNAVRAVQSGEAEHELPFGILEEVWSQRPRKLLGHVALTRFAVAEAEPHPPSEVNPLPRGSNHVCLMRHAAELVVKYDEGWALDQPGYHWAGVFRPLETSDDSYAMAEPPAHDDWVAESLADPRQKREVRVTFKRLREITRAFVAPFHPEIERENIPAGSTLGLSEALGGILAGLGGVPDPLPRKGGNRRGSETKSRRASVVVTEHRLVAVPSPGTVRASLILKPSHPDGRPVNLIAVISAASDGGEESIDASTVDLAWSPLATRASAPAGGFSYTSASDQETVLTIDFPSHVALDVEVKVAETRAH